MATPAVPSSISELTIESPDTGSLSVLLLQARYRLGRSPGNELSFPDDPKLSREHLIFEQTPQGWTVRDPGSLNGTLLNDARLTTVVQLQNGDKIAAGRLCIRYSAPDIRAGGVNDDKLLADHRIASGGRTISVDLKSALAGTTGLAHRPEAGGVYFQALVRAGRELGAQGSLDKLFALALDLSLETVRATRGVIMTTGGDGKLQVRAVHGDKLGISTAVRELVMKEAQSVLVRDVLMDQNFALQASIVAQDIRSILAVPLQTEHGVIGLLYLDSPQRVREFTTEDLNLITVIANIAAIRIEHARLIEQEQSRKLLDQDLARAAEIQKGLLPSSPPKIAGLDLAGYNVPCRTVGGDYYDFLPYADGSVAVLIGDVAGKGLGAALMMSSLQARAQVIFSDPGKIAEEVTRLNRSISASCPSNAFITFFMAAVHAGRSELVYCNAGHNPPILLRKNGAIETLAATGMPLGIFGMAKFEQRSCPFEEGDTLVLFSDGVTEACPPGVDEEYGEERLMGIVRSLQHDSAAALVERVQAELLAYTNGIAADDVTLVVVRRT